MTLKVLVAGVVKLRLKVVHAVVVAVKAALEPLTLIPRDVPVLFFIWKDNTAGVLGYPFVTDNVRPCDVVVKTKFW